MTNRSENCGKPLPCHPELDGWQGNTEVATRTYTCQSPHILCGCQRNKSGFCLPNLTREFLIDGTYVAYRSLKAKGLGEM